VALRILLVTDPQFGDDAIVRCVERAAAALPSGWLGVQLRDKRRPLVSLRIFASRLRQVTRGVGAALILNGNARLARDVGADGVHLGRDGGPVRDVRAVCGSHAWVSMAAHSDIAVGQAVDEGADAVLVSPVFASRPPGILAPGKEGRGVNALRSARVVSAGRIAVYALGGVDADNARACIEAGSHGVAVMRALLGSSDPARVAGAIRRAFGYGTRPDGPAIVGRPWRATKRR
jgi:thiamine-phosphate pyrophosphorylase